MLLKQRIRKNRYQQMQAQKKLHLLENLRFIIQGKGLDGNEANSKKYIMFQFEEGYKIVYEILTKVKEKEVKIHLSTDLIVLQNGVQEAFEITQFKNDSVQMLNVLVKQITNGAATIAGGGDTVNLVGANKANDKLIHASTGGGVSLKLLGGKILLDIEYLTSIRDLQYINIIQYHQQFQWISNYYDKLISLIVLREL